MHKNQDQSIPDTKRPTKGKCTKEKEREMALVHLQEMFSNQLEPGVVSLILSECEYNVDEALEKLFTISNDMKCETDNSAASQEKHSHHDVIVLDDFNEDMTVPTASSTSSNSLPLQSVNNSQSSSLSSPNGSSTSGLPDFPSLETFSLGNLGNYGILNGVYNGPSKPQHTTNSDQRLEAKGLQHDQNRKLHEPEIIQIGKMSEERRDDKNFGFGFGDVIADGSVIPRQQQFEHIIPSKPEDSVQEQKTKEKGYQLLVQHEETKVSPSAYNVENVSKDNEQLIPTGKEQEGENLQNKADLQDFNNFVKKCKFEGSQSTEWNKHTKGNNVTNYTPNFHSSFQNRSQQEGKIAVPPGHPSLWTHAFQTRMDPRTAFGKIPPDVSQQHPDKLNTYPHGLIPATHMQPIQPRPYFQQQAYHKDQLRTTVPSYITGVNSPQNWSALATSGMRTQELQWRMQRPEWRTQTHRRNKFPPQQRAYHFSHPNFALRNPGNQSDHGQIPSQHNKKLFIMRGLPGSGKSTLASKLKGFHGVVLSTDDFFYHKGRYVFEVSLLTEAHEWNQSRARRAMEGGMNPIIIDNTNTQAWEMKPYVVLGLKFGYHVEFKEPNTTWQWNVKELTRRNQHEVSEAAISRMLDRYEHNVTVVKIMNSRRPEFSQREKEKGSNHSKANEKEVNVVVSSDEESPKTQRVRQPRNRRKQQDQATLLPKDDDHNTAETSSMQSSENGILDDDSVNKTPRSIYAGNHSTSESNVSASSLVTEGDKPMPQRTFARRRNQRERHQSSEQFDKRETTLGGQEVNETNSFVSSVDTEALIETSCVYDSGKEASVVLDTKNTNLVTDIQQCTNNMEGERTLSVERSGINPKPVLFDEIPEKIEKDNVSEALVTVEDNGNEALVSVKDNIDCKRVVGTSEMEDELSKAIDNASKGVSSITSGDYSQHQLSDNSGDNVVEGSPTKVEGLHLGDPLSVRSTPPPLPHLLASLTKNKRTAVKERKISRKDCQNDFPQDQDVQKSSFELQQKTSKILDSTNVDILAKPLNLQSSSIEELADTASSSRHNEDKEIASNCGTDIQSGKCGETYKFLKTCFPAVDPEIILDLLTRHGEEEVPKIVDSLLSMDTFQDKELADETSTGSKQSPKQVGPQPFVHEVKSEDIEPLQDRQNKSPENSRSPSSPYFHQTALSDTSEVPRFPNSLFPNPPYRDIPSQISSTETPAHLQFQASTSDGRSASRIQRHTTELDQVVDKSNTLQAEALDINSASAQVGQAFTLEESDSDVEEIQTIINVDSPPDVSRSIERRFKHAATEQEGLGNSSSQHGNKGRVQWLDNLNLTLEPALAMQLVEMFGSIQGLQFKGEIAEQDLIVKLDGKLARILYERWKETVQECRRSGNKGRDSQSEEKTKSVQRKPLLQQIMEEEKATELHLKHQAVSNSSTWSSSSAATMMKRQKLYEMFPGVNRSALDELLQANRYELHPTIQTVKMSCNLQEKPRTVVASGPILSPQSPPSQNLSSNDQTEEDWNSTFERALAASMLESSASSTDDSYQALNDPGYDDYRAESAMHARQREECFKKAALAFSKKQGPLAQFYALQGHQHTQKLKEANWRAAKKILQSRNCYLDENTIDLHGLHVEEALCALEEILLVKSTEDSAKCITVVTGRGSHSKGGRARIKPAVLDYLVRKKYRFEEVNQGQFKVFL